MRKTTYLKRNALLVLVAFIISSPLWSQSKQESVIVKWLDNTAPKQSTGLSWGVPWPQGAVKKNQTFILTTNDGRNLPLQTWPIAYWPDGSLKWSGLATVAGPEAKGNLKLTPGKTKPSKSDPTIQIKETNESIQLNTGPLQCIISKKGSFIIDSLKIAGKVVSVGGKLVCLLQNGPDNEYDSPVKEKFVSTINKVTVEQSGPVRAVVRFQGLHKSEKSERAWLPFDVRLYFYAGLENIRLVHTIVFDGDDQKDFIKGLGVSFSVPMREDLHNRHVRLAGEDSGMWVEPIRPLTGRRVISLNNKNVYEDQLAGKRIANYEEFATREKGLIKDLAAWSDYKLVQGTADGYAIQKRTNDRSCWLDAVGGKRSSGLAFVGDVSGGLAIGVKNFWQSYPAALEIRGAATSMAELRVWLWSPYSEAMDLRHYDTTAHGLEASYEDVQPGYSTPYGVARTSELMLYPSGDVPSIEKLSNESLISSHPPLLVCTPEYLHSIAAFGVWSLPDRSKPGKAWVEDQLSQAIDLYKMEVEQRHWYGFWNYGDVMHAYDPVRHMWRYDIGGYAWANSELAPDVWLWYSFLRTGRSDIFRMAEAMTRHTGEVDVYHIGKFARLGSRHNVRHWGCGAKESRISQAAYRRYYYYLTTDERTGDLMREVARSDSSLLTIDPLRLILPPSQYPTHARIGPDWIAFVGNWMTEWERTGDKRWKDMILAGVNSFAAMPYGFFSGKEGAFGYDPKSNKLYMLNEGDIGSSHLASIMGGSEVAFELSSFLDSPAWKKLWLQYCEMYGMSKEEVAKIFNKEVRLGDLGVHYARLPAYLAREKNDPLLAEKAWSIFLTSKDGQFDPKLVQEPDTQKPTYEVPTISTNNAAQWCLNAIELLELVGDKIPEHNTLWEP